MCMRVHFFLLVQIYHIPMHIPVCVYSHDTLSLLLYACFCQSHSFDHCHLAKLKPGFSKQGYVKAMKASRLDN